MGKYDYLSQTSQDAFSRIPSSEIYLPRLLQQKPDYYKKIAPTGVWKKKVLIFNDPSAYQWNEVECTIAAERLHALQKEGYKIYTYELGFFQELDTRADLPLQFKQTMVSDESLKKMAINQFALSSDETFVLNQQELSELIEGSDDDWLPLQPFETINLSNSNLSLKSLSHLFNKAGSVIKELNLAGCLNLHQGCLPDGIALEAVDTLNIAGNLEIPSEALGKSLDRFNTINPTAVKQILKASPNLRRLIANNNSNLDESILDDLQLATLEEIDLSGSKINDSFLDKLIKIAPNIKKLNISNCSYLTRPDALVKLHGLKELNASSTSISSAALNEILLNNPEINKFQLENCKSLTENLHGDFHLKALTEFKLSGASMDSASLGLILAKAPNLQSLSIKRCFQISGNLGELPLLESLQELDLVFSNWNASALSQLLTLTPNLKKLDLTSCSKIQEDFVHLPNLEKLEELQIAGSNISTAGLEAILNKANNIKAISLHYCAHIKEAFTDLSAFDSLETLDLSHSSIPNTVLTQFLSKSPKLQILNLAYCKELTGITASLPPLAALKTLDLGSSSFDMESIQEILNKAPNITELNLSANRELHNNAGQLSRLNALERLNLSFSTINSFNLNQFLLNTPEIKELYLDNCKNLQDLVDADLQLKAIEILHLQKSNLNSSFLSELLSNATQLQELNLTSCRNIQEDLEGSCALPALKKLQLSDSNLNSASLDKLLSDCQNLKVLDLTACKNIQNNLENTTKFAELENLQLSSSSINNQALGKLLAHASKLETLNLISCQNIAGNLEGSPELPALKNINLKNSVINSFSLDKLLAHSTKLQTLNLENCKNIHENLSNTPNLAFLETLLLARSQINSQALGKLLAKASRLKTLDLENCKNLNLSSMEGIPELHSLEKLALQNTTINSAALDKILTKCQKLRSLDLSDCKYIHGALVNTTNLPSLDTLRLSRSQINSQALGKLLANASSLQELHLSDCTNLQGDLGLRPNLSALEFLHANNTSLNSQALGQLLTNCIKLKDLQLAGSKNLQGDLGKTPNLFEVETINLAGSTINSQTLGKLLANTAQLITLNLENCTIIDDGFINDLKLDALEELNIKGASISSALLEKIKAKAPKDLIIRQDAFRKEPIPIPSTLSPAKQKPQSPKEEERLDADTAPNPEMQYNLDRIFYTANNLKLPGPSAYRLKIYDSFRINQKSCDIQEAFSLTNTTKDLGLKPIKIKKASQDLYPSLSALPDDNRYYGKQNLTLTEEWQALASLSANEKMTHYHLNQPVDVEIQYSKRDNLYYIRRKSATELSATEPRASAVTIDFILEVPETKGNLPKDIQEKVQDCLEFKANALNITKLNPTGNDYLQALKTKKVGACRHRALVFKDWMQEKYPKTPTRIVYNHCHAFVEIYYNNQWISCNLGGYPAELLIDESNRPAITQTTTTVKRVLPEPTRVKLTEAGKTKADKQKTPYFVSEKAIPKKAEPPKLFVEHLLSKPAKNILLQLPLSKDRAGLRHQIQQYCQSTKKPCFYIHSPEDLVCSAPFIERQGNKGYPKNGPGGPLHQFLTAHQNDGTKPVLIVNYEQFSASDIVRFNALLDTNRLADDSALPDDATVIGLMNPDKPGAYNGQDFLSRFDEIISNPLFTESLNLPILTEPRPLGSESVTIDLYGGANWESQLLGHWQLHGQELQFVEGELIVALKNNKTQIDLKNAPWEDEAFQCFFQQAKLYGAFQYQGLHYPLPQDFKLSQSTGYDFEERALSLSINETVVIPKDAFVLNPGLLSEFYGQYQVDNTNHTIQYADGLLKAHQGQSLNIYLSEPLALPNWALFLDKATQYGVKIQLSLAPGVTLADEFSIKAAKTKVAEPSIWSGQGIPTTAYLQSSDIDATLDLLQEEALIFDISEVSPTDLLLKKDGCYNQETSSFYFTEEEGVLLTALKGNKTVILKGQIKDELRYALTSFLLERQRNQDPEGRLLLVSEEPTPFHMVPSFRQTISLQEKKALLPKDSFSNALIEKENLCTLKARLRYQQSHPMEKEASKHWEGLTHLPPAKNLEPLDLTNAEQRAEAFNQQRVDAVTKTLENTPFVFLAGMTGVGKTTFIQEVWKKENPAVYIGEDSVGNWAASQSEGLKTLFIDEANISSKQWSQFEGLFNDPPGILIGNIYKPLSKDHKIIFAGNPLSYGGERALPALFARHGNSILFEPLPPAYLYQALLKPIFDKTGLNSEELAIAILAINQFLATVHPDKILISPRELSMMALLTEAYCKNNPEADPKTVVQYYAYTLAERFVPEESKASFQEKFGTVLSLPHPERIKPEDYFLTPSNQVAFDALADALDLRSLRQTREIQAEGGLGGLIFEGEPGIGKTELVAKTLVAQGIKKGKLHKAYPDKQVFYKLPMSMSFAEKEKLLMKAFHEGSIVVIDEINAAPMMERLLNDLLMGKDPEGNPAKQPGFMIIGTQNPPTMAGRLRASTALEHRMQTIKMPEYTREEMVHILSHKGLRKDISQELVDEYLLHREKNDLSRHLCFRDLLKRAEQEIKLMAKPSAPPLSQEKTQALATIHKELARLNLVALPILSWSGKEIKIAAYQQIITAILQSTSDQSLNDVLKNVKKQPINLGNFQWKGVEYYVDKQGNRQRMEKNTPVTVDMVLGWQRNKWSMFSSTSGEAWQKLKADAKGPKM